MAGASKGKKRRVAATKNTHAPTPSVETKSNKRSRGNQGSPSNKGSNKQSPSPLGRPTKAKAKVLPGAQGNTVELRVQRLNAMKDTTLTQACKCLERPPSRARVAAFFT